METYNLRFKHSKNERGYWNTTIFAENKNEAIEKAKDIVTKLDYKNAKLEKIVYSHRKIYDFEKGEK